MVDGVYMSVGKSTPPQTQEEMLDSCWLNGGLALIKAFIEATAKKHGFENVKVTSPHTDYPRVDLAVAFDCAAHEKKCKNVRAPHRERNLRSFEQEILDVTGYMNKNLVNNHPKGHESYTIPLSRDFIPRIASEIKKRLADKVPVSAFIAQLKR